MSYSGPEKFSQGNLDMLLAEGVTWADFGIHQLLGHLARLEKTQTISVSCKDIQRLCPYLMNRTAWYRSLDRLTRIGWISIERIPGREPLITVLHRSAHALQIEAPRASERSAPALQIEAPRASERSAPALQIEAPRASRLIGLRASEDSGIDLIKSSEENKTPLPPQPSTGEVVVVEARRLEDSAMSHEGTGIEARKAVFDLIEQTVVECFEEENREYAEHVYRAVGQYVGKLPAEDFQYACDEAWSRKVELRGWPGYVAAILASRVIKSRAILPREGGPPDRKAEEREQRRKTEHDAWQKERDKEALEVRRAKAEARAIIDAEKNRKGAI